MGTTESSLSSPRNGQANRQQGPSRDIKQPLLASALKPVSDGEALAAIPEGAISGGIPKTPGCLGHIGGCIDDMENKIRNYIWDSRELQNIRLHKLESPYSNDAILAGQHIRAAFAGSVVVEKDAGLLNLVRRSCERANEAAKQHPVLVLGRFGQGKSSLINSLLGKTEADCGRYDATTMGVDIYPMNTSLPIGKILLCDTPGWEPEKTGNVLKLYKAALEQKGLCTETLPDVTLFVVAGTPQGMREFSSIVESRNLAREYRPFLAATDARSVLIPVITFADAASGKMQKEDQDIVREKLEGIKSLAKQDFDVLDPIYVSNINHEGVYEVKKRVTEAVTKSFQCHSFSRPWFQHMQDDLVSEVKQFEKQHPEIQDLHPQLFRRTISALSLAYGHQAEFSTTYWHLLPTIKKNLAGDRQLYFSSRMACLTIVVLFCALQVCIFSFFGVGGTYAQKTWQGKNTDDFLQQPLPSVFQWDVTDVSSRTRSPLFSRGGVPDMQLIFDPNSKPKGGVDLRLLAPDGWTVHFTLWVDDDERNVKSSFPCKNATEGAGHYGFASHAKSYRVAGIKIDNAVESTPVSKNQKLTYSWDVSVDTTSGIDQAFGIDDAYNSNSFTLGNLSGLALSFYPGGNSDDQVNSGKASSLYLCGPSGWTLRFRLFVDDISRTLTHNFQADLDDFLGLSSACAGVGDFSLRKKSYGTVGVELLNVHSSQ